MDDDRQRDASQAERRVDRDHRRVAGVDGVDDSVLSRPCR